MVWQSRVVSTLAIILYAIGMAAQDEPRIIVGTDTITPSTLAASADSVADVRLVVGGDTLRPSQYVAGLEEELKIPLLHGIDLAVDVFGPIMYALTDYGSAEASLRVSLKNQFFPVVEVGYGKCDHTDDNTNITFSTAAPFFRAGLDYNLLKNKRQDNRFTVGLRYGFTSFKYDMRGPDMTDPVWGGTAPFNYSKASSTCQWAELVVGVQVKLFTHFHLGWTVRYRKEMKVGENDHSRPYYIPGYGTTTNTSCWGGTYSLIFDLKL